MEINRSHRSTLCLSCVYILFQEKKDRELEKQRQLDEKERVRKEKQDEKEKQEKLEKAKQEKLAQSFKSFFKPASLKSCPGGQDRSQQSKGVPGDSSESGGEDGKKSGMEDTEAAVTAGILNKFRVKKDMRLAPVSRRSGGLQESERSALEASLLGGVSDDKPSLHLYLGLLKSGCHKALSSGRTWKVEAADAARDEDEVQVLEEDEDEGPQMVMPGCSVEIDIADMEDNKKVVRSFSSVTTVTADFRGPTVFSAIDVVHCT